MVLALNTISGQIADVSPKLLEHPKFKDILEVVEVDSKPYVAELYKSGTKTEKAARKSKKEEVVIEAAPIVEDEVVAEEVTEIPEIEEEN
jgi:hypothetical protein